MDAVPLVEGMTDIRNVATFFVFLTLIALACPCVLVFLKEINRNDMFCSIIEKSDHHFSPQVKVKFAAVVILVLPFIPASNLFFYVGFVVAERVLYIPSMGLSLLVACGLYKLYRRIPMVITFFNFLVLVYASKTIVRNMDWYSEENLFVAGIKVNPAKSFGNLGNILHGKGKMSWQRQHTKKP